MASSVIPLRNVLVVEPDDHIRSALASSIRTMVAVDAHASFETARGQIFSSFFDLLVTNVRLEAYNGLHLTYLARQSKRMPRAVVYAAQWDRGTAMDVQRAGAFFELLSRMTVSLPAYVGTALPARDRRDAARFDRRVSVRGGRRLWDLHILSALGTV